MNALLILSLKFFVYPQGLKWSCGKSKVYDLIKE